MVVLVMRASFRSQLERLYAMSQSAGRSHLLEPFDADVQAPHCRPSHLVPANRDAETS